MGDVRVKQMPPLQVQELSGVEPLRIAQIAPAAVHIKELNHIDPISVDSLRVSEVSNVEPVRIERFDVTHLPTVDLSLSRFPTVDLNVRRFPPVAIGVSQEFHLPSEYTVHARLLGVEVLRLRIHGHTKISPKDRVHREQARTHDRSAPAVAAVGNPAIPTERVEECVEVVTRPRHQPAPRPPAPSMVPRPRAGGPAHGASLSVGSPRFSYSISPPPAAGESGAVSFGGAA